MACGCCVGMACRADALLGSRYGGKAMARRSFDIADVYGRGACESLLGEVFAANPGLRDRVILQSKVGIRKEDDGFTWYDFSKEHIIEAVDASLSRLGVDHVDSMLLQTCHIDGEMPPVERAIVCARLGRVKRAKAMAMRFGSNVPSVAHVSAAANVPYRWARCRQLNAPSVAHVSATSNVHNRWRRARSAVVAACEK